MLPFDADALRCMYKYAEFDPTTLERRPHRYFHMKPWNYQGHVTISFHAKASQIARKLVESWGLDPDTATAGEMDECEKRVFCKRCIHHGRGSVLDWRHAVSCDLSGARTLSLTALLSWSTFSKPSMRTWRRRTLTWPKWRTRTREKRASSIAHYWHVGIVLIAAWNISPLKTCRGISRTLSALRLVALETSGSLALSGKHEVYADEALCWEDFHPSHRVFAGGPGPIHREVELTEEEEDDLDYESESSKLLLLLATRMLARW
jgi:hypothetical protein